MEQSVEEKLKALFELQTLHTQIDKIRQTRGELPMEVSDLEDEVAGLETRIQKIKAELDELEDTIVTRKNMIKDALAATKKYDDQLKDVKNNREYDAISKEVELDTITAETEKDEVSIQAKAEVAEKHIEERLLIAYHRLRRNAKNGLAVVTIKRDSCSGCFNQIPPQRQLDIRQRKRIIVCEHCGRIVVDEGYAEEAVPATV